MHHHIKELIKKLKEDLPGSLGVGLFCLKEGMILEAEIDVPDYNPEYAGAVHAEIWRKIKDFINLLPPSMRGKIKNIMLEMKSVYLQLTAIGDEDFLIMTGIPNDNNPGMLRYTIKKYKKKFEEKLL